MSICTSTIARKKIKYVKILSDSQAAVKSLKKLRITSQSVLTTLEYTETLSLKVKKTNPSMDSGTRRYRR